MSSHTALLVLRTILVGLGLVPLAAGCNREALDPNTGGAMADLAILLSDGSGADLPPAPDLWMCRSNFDCQGQGGGAICCDKMCVDPANDPKNCGACGAQCPPLPNLPTLCSFGTCVRPPCNAGYWDCDGSGINGCETALNQDPQNCGACGRVCAVSGPNVLPICKVGVCGTFCVPGFVDCDGKPESGCEIDTTFDVNHCGRCGNVCPTPPHAKAACDQGSCGFRCALDFGNCDGDARNGCETDVRTDDANCGRCGNSCPPAAHCVASRCR